MDIPVGCGPHTSNIICKSNILITSNPESNVSTYQICKLPLLRSNQTFHARSNSVEQILHLDGSLRQKPDLSGFQNKIA